LPFIRQMANPAEARFCRRCGYSFAGLRPGFVRIIQPPGVTWEMPIRDKSLLIGREPTADMQVPCLDLDFYDPKGYLSRRHAVIMRNENGYFISDLGSENGSWLNGQRLTSRQPQPLRNGDEMQLAQVKLRFEIR
jgi:pSer/pThr/pTyr-binding forkhead associated (FHA) protein